MPKKPTRPVRSRTEQEHHTTLKYLQKWSNTIKKFPTFAEFLLAQKMAQATRCKHIKQAAMLIKRKNLPGGNNLGTLSPPLAKPPIHFCDQDFEQLYLAFNNAEKPTFIQSEERQRYWQCIIHFAAITALRREAILGLTIDNVNFQELFVTIPPDIDKKNTERYKPITRELAEEILNLRRFYDNKQILPARRKLIFPWIHGSKSWYKCWNAAEKKIGKRFHLHDLKRFAGILALRAGASPLELQQHMDHADLATTLKHYCRPQTTQLVQRIKVPIPKSARHKMQTPLFTEPELTAIIQEHVTKKLRELGIENPPNFLLDQFGNALIRLVL